MSAKIFFGGPILSMDDINSSPEAIGILDERIVANGSLADVQAKLPNAQMHDLVGRCLIPAFIDPHGHFPDSAIMRLLRVDLSAGAGSQSLVDVLEKLAVRAGQTAPGEWVMGAGIDECQLADGRLPTRDELDAISAQHPVWVLHASGHCGVANSAALARQGITEASADPEGGRYLRDDAGRLTGGIEGLSAMGDMGETHFLIDPAGFARCFAEARDEYLAQGVTLAQNAWASDPLLGMFHQMAMQGDPGIDVIILPMAEVEPGFSTTGQGAGWPEGAIQPGPRKLLVDGSFMMRTAALSAPYHTGAPGKAADCGLVYLDAETLRREVLRLHQMGFQIHVHCNGDRASDMLLDAVDAALAAAPRPDHRHTIIHGQVMRKDQIARCKALGVSISFFPAHIWFWGDQHHAAILGPERAARISPAGWAVEQGLRFTIHNDAAVTPTRPLKLISTAVNRLTRAGRLLGADQRISPLAALRSHTIDAAWQVFREDERGSLEPGKLADLAILSRNPLDDPGRIGNISVVETWRRGRCVYRSNRIGAGGEV